MYKEKIQQIRQKIKSIAVPGVWCPSMLRVYGCVFCSVSLLSVCMCVRMPLSLRSIAGVFKVHCGTSPAPHAPSWLRVAVRAVLLLPLQRPNRRQHYESSAGLSPQHKRLRVLLLARESLVCRGPHILATYSNAHMENRERAKGQL